MNIGFVSAWFERGAGNVTKSYIDLLENENNIYVYARGGEYFEKKDYRWNKKYVTWGLRLYGTEIYWHHFRKWIKKNKLDTIFFNEQQDFEVIFRLKSEYPNLKIGSYVDYYTEETIKFFSIFDFLICNTKRHYSIFKNHSQCYYIPWGVNIDLYKPNQRTKDNKEIVFFHSAGLSSRKGTDLLIQSFIKGKLYKNSKLVIHCQKKIENITRVRFGDLSKYNIEIIKKTVGCPGLYYLGDVYVYPTYLEGLGLTIYEALSCGLPVVTTDNAPMNEIVNNDIGKLVEVGNFYCRNDGYYWPLAICKQKSLIAAMNFYINCDFHSLALQQKKARAFAEKYLNWNDRSREVRNIFYNSKISFNNSHLSNALFRQYRKDKIVSWTYKTVNLFLNPYLRQIVYKYLIRQI